MTEKLRFSVEEHMASVREADDKICQKITEESKRRIEKIADEIRAKHCMPTSSKTSVRQEEKARAPCEETLDQDNAENTSVAADSTTPTNAKTYATATDDAVYDTLSTTLKDAEKAVKTPSKCSNASWNSNVSDPQYLRSLSLSMPDVCSYGIAPMEGGTTLALGYAERQPFEEEVEQYVVEEKIVDTKVERQVIGGAEEVAEVTTTGGFEKIAELTATSRIEEKTKLATTREVGGNGSHLPATTNLFEKCERDEISDSCKVPFPSSERPTPTGEVAETSECGTPHCGSDDGSFLTFDEMKKLERLLGRDDVLGRDWRMIADHLNLTADDIAYIRDKEAVRIVLDMWMEYGLTREDLITFLESEKMERHDAADILKETKASSGTEECESASPLKQTKKKEEVLTRVLANTSIRVPRRSLSRRNLEFYDIYLSCDEMAENRGAKRDFLKICQRNDWICFHGELFQLGKPKLDAVSDAVEQSSYIVFLIGNEMTEKSHHDLNMAFEHAFQHNAYRDGMLIPVPYTENAQLPSKLKPLVAANLYDMNFEDKMKSAIDVSIRRERVAESQAL